MSPIHDLKGSSVVWESTDDETYYLFVYGFEQGAQGDFSILVTEVNPPENDMCVDATPLDPSGDAVKGSTILATIDEGLSYCGTASNSTSAGVWYVSPKKLSLAGSA